MAVTLAIDLAVVEADGLGLRGGAGCCFRDPSVKAGGGAVDEPQSATTCLARSSTLVERSSIVATSLAFVAAFSREIRCRLAVSSAITARLVAAAGVVA